MDWVSLFLEQIVNETLPALLKLKETGKIRFIGITGLPLHIFTYVLDRVPPGTVDVILSYCHYSINDSTLEDLLPYLKSKGVGVISASPLAMGLLTEIGPPEWHPASPEIKVFFPPFFLSNLLSVALSWLSESSISTRYPLYGLLVRVHAKLPLLFAKKRGRISQRSLCNTACLIKTFLLY